MLDSISHFLLGNGSYDACNIGNTNNDDDE